jgi:hypothetical protein
VRREPPCPYGDSAERIEVFPEVSEVTASPSRALESLNSASFFRRLVQMGLHVVVAVRRRTAAARGWARIRPVA